MLTCLAVLFYYMRSHWLLFFPGPWYIGRLAGDKYGVVFMWGIFVDSSALPGELTYPDAFFLVSYYAYFAYYVNYYVGELWVYSRVIVDYVFPVHIFKNFCWLIRVKVQGFSCVEQSLNIFYQVIYNYFYTLDIYLFGVLL